MPDEIKKEFSGRKFITVTVISTYCFVIVMSVVFTLLKFMTIDVFLALLSGFGTLAMYITKAYYDDKVRATENGGQK
jgi:uncharacterized membrane protein YagU involved in acid resistance